MPSAETRRKTSYSGPMTKLEAEVVKAALIWHTVNVFRCRPLHRKEDKALRVASINLMRKQDHLATEIRLEVALKRR